MQTTKTYAGNELSHELAILQLARASTSSPLRLADRQYAHSKDAAELEEHQQILQSLVSVKRDIQDTVDTLLADE